MKKKTQLILARIIANYFEEFDAISEVSEDEKNAILLLEYHQQLASQSVVLHNVGVARLTEMRDSRVETFPIISDFLDSAISVAGSYTECFDGSGQLGKMGCEISLLARITAVLLVQDTLIHSRPPWSKEKIHKLLADLKGNQLDPVVVDIVLSLSDDFAEFDSDLTG